MGSVDLHCICGASATGDIPESEREAFIKGWKARHSGNGHRLCAPSRALLARHQADKTKSLTAVSQPKVEELGRPQCGITFTVDGEIICVIPGEPHA